MNARIVPLRRPVTRRVELAPGVVLIVRLTEEGLEVRGLHKRSWRRWTWTQIAALADSEARPILLAAERAAGAAEIERLTRASRASRRRRRTHHSPLTTHHSPLTTHHSPLTTHHSPLTGGDS
jgi:hypothetical protein